MRVINIINLKGGVAKSISAINIAYIIAAHYGKRVLLIDNDKQGNASKFFGLHDYGAPSIADVLTVKDFDIRDAIRATGYDGLDVLPANMNLLRANKELLMDASRPQQTRLAKALAGLVDAGVVYDDVIIDNAPDINLSAINALVACHDVLIPIKVDQFAFDGLEQLAEQIRDAREFNPRVHIAGCFITMYQRNNVCVQGAEWLAGAPGIPMFKTMIRKTVAVDESTFAGQPLHVYAPGCTAARDYAELVAEYVGGIK